MQNGEKLIAIESIIFNFAQEQFSANNVSPLEARLIMEAVEGKFQKIGLESFIMGMISIGEPGGASNAAAEGRASNGTAAGRGKKQTGTLEDLKDAIKKSGFIPDDQKGK